MLKIVYNDIFLLVFKFVYKIIYSISNDFKCFFILIYCQNFSLKFLREIITYKKIIDLNN